MVKAQTPTIANIKNKASETDARALISIALCEVCDFFNVGKNMNDTQVALTADLIIESYWYMKLEEIKFCFRRAMRRGKLYDRLDGNIILGWLAEYDDERTEVAMNLSEQKESEAANAVSPDDNTSTFTDYYSRLEVRAANGEEVAVELVSEIEKLRNISAKTQTRDEFHKKKLEFLQFWYNEYLPNKKDERI